MIVPAKTYLSEEAYLAFEQASSERHEYYQGEIYAMTGGTETHNLLAGNTFAALHNQLSQRPCRVYTSDQRVKVVATGLHTYPDVTVVCGQAQFLEDSRRTLLNPTVIIEVLSPSTERYDRGMKFQHYRTIETLQVYVLIAQDSWRIEHYHRHEGDAWVLREAQGQAAVVHLATIQCTLPLAAVYAKVALPSEASALSQKSEEGRG
ncbi:MAG: Uma2 family endonuclease [Candidatus Viridilinea halotolerans]|uniref:Uma2 family endonuclease n=1 Tax=Candidatus Viridilinea halotolerans TaxID=2491704 RepID=A0A426TXG8_9CHLR|nr:MAG: Uma2 family endonuclease [Candidatus Viridilinea halotolerans]